MPISGLGGWGLRFSTVEQDDCSDDQNDKSKHQEQVASSDFLFACGLPSVELLGSCWASGLTHLSSLINVISCISLITRGLARVDLVGSSCRKWYIVNKVMEGEKLDMI